MIRKLTILLFLISMVVSFNICESGSYWSGQQKRCIRCEPTCEICGPDGCYRLQQQIGLAAVESQQIKRRFLVTNCGDLQCGDCVNGTCIACIDGYASNGGGPLNCQTCHSSCQTCTTPNNDGTCDSCIVGKYLNPSNRCVTCSSAFSNNCVACDQTQCTDCVANFYPDPSGPQCVACSSITNCLNCTNMGCTACQEYYQLLPNGTCTDLCGDFYIITLPCDNAIGVPYDGCDDTCQIMDDFYCSVNGTSGICQFTGQLVITQVSLVKPEFENKLELVVSLFPPLYAFTDTDLNQLFSINQTDLHVDRMSYADGKLTVQMSFTVHVADKPFQLLFSPNSTTDPRFVLTPPAEMISKVSTVNSAYYYSSTNFALAKLLATFSYILIALTWLIYLIAIFSNKLAGLQLIFVLQYIWVTIYFIPGQLPLPYIQTIPLKYSSGYAFPLTTINHKTSLPIQSQDFYTDGSYFSNNFNLMLLLYVVPLVGVCVCRIIACNKEYKEFITPKLQFFIQKVMYGVMTNLIALTLFSCVFFASTQKTHVGSIIIFSVALLITLGTLIKFFFDPDPFNRFRYSFNKQCLAFHHYYLHVINLITMVLLLVLFPNIAWVCCIPVGLIMVETLAYRPYVELSENLRSFYYHLLMLLTVVLKLVYSMNDNNWRFSEVSAILLVVLVCGLYLLAVVWAYVEVIREFCTRQQKEQSPEKQKLEYTLFQDLKLMKQISNPEKLMQMTGINPMKAFAGGAGMETSRHSDNYSNMDEDNEENALKNRYRKQQEKNQITESEQQNYPQTGHMIKITTPRIQDKNKQIYSSRNSNKNQSQKNLNNMEGMEKESKSDLEKNQRQIKKAFIKKKQQQNDWQQYDENDVKIIVKNPNLSLEFQEKRPIFKVNEFMKPIFSTFSESLGLPLTPTAKIEQNINENEQKIQKEQNKFEQMDEMKKLIIKDLIKKQIKFVKMKNAEELIKPKDEKLLEIYEAI